MIPASFADKVIELRGEDGSRAQVSSYGAHVLTWQTADGLERLFLSQRAVFEEGKAIRGGVPLLFPQFAKLGGLSQHGFARVSQWTVIAREESRVLLELSDSERTRALWPHRFVLQLAVTLHAHSLEMELLVRNVDEAPFEFTGGLHTYVRVPDVAEAVVRGLQGKRYQDNAAGNEATQRGGSELVDAAEAVRFAGEVDRLYQDVDRMVVGGGNFELLARQVNFLDGVVWNPGPEKCAAMADMETDGFRRFVCLEAVVAPRKVLLLPGDAWHGSQLLEAGVTSG